MCGAYLTEVCFKVMPEKNFSHFPFIQLLKAQCLLSVLSTLISNDCTLESKHISIFPIGFTLSCVFCMFFLCRSDSCKCFGAGIEYWSFRLMKLVLWQQLPRQRTKKGKQLKHIIITKTFLWHAV